MHELRECLGDRELKPGEDLKERAAALDIRVPKFLDGSVAGVRPQSSRTMSGATRGTGARERRDWKIALFSLHSKT
jgi:hypothetical protein